MLQIKPIRFNCKIYVIKCKIYKREVINLKKIIYKFEKNIRDTNEKWNNITI